MNDNNLTVIDNSDYITTNLPNWSDDETLRQFFKFFPRVVVTTEFLNNDEGAVIGQCIVVMAGNKIVFSEPQPLDWPLMPVPAPEVSVDGEA